MQEIEEQRKFLDSDESLKNQSGSEKEEEAIEKKPEGEDEALGNKLAEKQRKNEEMKKKQA